MAERFLVGSASRTGEVVVFIEPEGVGGELDCGRAHLVDSRGHELPQSHEGLWGPAGGLFIVGEGGGIGVPIFK